MYPGSVATFDVRVLLLPLSTDSHDAEQLSDVVETRTTRNRSSTRLQARGEPEKGLLSSDDEDDIITNIAQRTRNNKQIISCSDYGADRATKYSNYHFCRPCELYDEMRLFNKNRTIKRNSKTYKCIIDHTNAKRPTLLKNAFVHYSLRDINNNDHIDHLKDDVSVCDTNVNDDVKHVGNYDNIIDGSSDDIIPSGTNDTADDFSNTKDNISITGGNIIINEHSNKIDNDVEEFLGDYNYSPVDQNINNDSNNDTSDDEGPRDKMMYKNDDTKKMRKNQSTFFNNDVLYEDDSDDDQLSVPHNNKLNNS